ncbi:MAG: glycogen synthase [Bacteroidetes bacterium GWF2_49_14]|nr:MAG: glycogen synthase [Bacteroidetes bacterium GWF2_49_14]HBB92847.1 glycogen synthase [Bacteroidales bacterium]
MKKHRVLYISQEITPYLPESEMANVSRYLPQGIQERGREIRTFMPRFGSVNERRNQLHEVIRLSGMNLIINESDHPLIIKVASIQAARMQVYFIDNEDYFQRRATWKDEEGTEFPDNDERAIFFARGVLETVRKLRWAPDLVHCHGWFTSIIPLYLKKVFHDDPLFSNAKVVCSLYQDGFKTPLNEKFKEKLLMPGINPADVSVLEVPDFVHVSKMAISHSDALVVGSQVIDPEIDKFLRASGKPFLEYQGTEQYADAFSDFYRDILGV